MSVEQVMEAAKKQGVKATAAAPAKITYYQELEPNPALRSKKAYRYTNLVLIFPFMTGQKFQRFL